MFNENDNEICGLRFVESSAKTNELKSKQQAETNIKRFKQNKAV